MPDRLAFVAEPLPDAVFEDLARAIRILTIDAVEAAGCGHPGMPLGMAEAAATLWSEFLVFDRDDPMWQDRDRFVLSAGHGSMLLYSLLHLFGRDLSVDDLKRFRQLDSRTPGHPEYGHTAGVEVTTGPLGTGFAAGVGLAIAERVMRTRYGGEAGVVDHFTYGIVSDGDLMEGVAAEAASLAGHLGLGKLVYLYDCNGITIDGGTDLAFGEDVAGRFRAYGWHVQDVDGHDRAAVRRAIMAARREQARPSLIACRTVIGKGSPGKAGTSAVHGARLGPAEAAATKAAIGAAPEPFVLPAALRERLEPVIATRRQVREAWEARRRAWEAAQPEAARELVALLRGETPAAALTDLPRFSPGTALATRVASRKVLEVLAPRHGGLIGGSADLAESNGTNLEGEPAQSAGRPGGRVLHFGVREHGMAGIANGLALHGGLRPYVATFLVFSDFMRGCVRLAALMGLPVTYVFTHDSILLGEDGPTHQPVEHVMSLRMIPGLHVVRPADAKETVGAWRHALSRGLGDGPTALVLTRQNLPVLEETRDDVSRGAYVLWQPAGDVRPDVLVIATGSEVELGLRAARELERTYGKRARVVSMPCWEAFAAQEAAYRDEVLPPGVPSLALEAGVTLGWQRWATHVHGIDRFGASAPAADLAAAYGMTQDVVVARLLELA